MQANTINFIQQIPTFANLPPEDLELVAQAFEIRSYKQNEVIFQQGTPAEGVFTITAGQAVMLQTNQQGRQQPVATLIAGQTINEQALFNNIQHQGTLIASRPVQALKLTRNKFTTLLSYNPDLKAAFGLTPKDTTHHVHEVRFDGQRENEEVLLYIHRHWWAFARMAWLPILIMMVMWFMAIFIGQPTISTLLFFGSILLPGLATFYLYVEWRNDAVIITDQRVRRIRRTILTFSKKVSEVGIESVHEVNSEVPAYDPFARLFNYGDIEIKTAGSAGNLYLDLIPNPDHVQQIIIEDRQRYEHRQQQQHRNSVRAELESWLDGSTPNRISHAGGGNAPADTSGKPKAKQGTNGYLSTRIAMSNGDVVYRKHVFFWFQQAIIPILLMLFSGIVSLFALVASGNFGFVALPFGIVMFLIGAMAYFWVDWDWRNDYYVVSDETITLIHRRPFFLQSLRDQILIERVDNVEAESSGFLASVFNFGDLRVSLIGADDHKMFNNVPRPQQIQQDISTRQQRVKQQASEAEARQQREVLAEYLNVYNERLADQGIVDGQIQNPTPNYPAEGQFGNTAPGTDATTVYNNLPNRPANNSVPIRATNNYDRSRPPGIPRKQPSGTPRRPSLSPGVPYDPAQNQQPTQGRSRPPRFRPRNPNPDDTV